MFLTAIRRREDVRGDGFPWTLPLIGGLQDLAFTKAVTFLVGENGSGKSTLLEGLAAGMDAVAVGRRDLARDESLAAARAFAGGFRFVRRRHAKVRLFLRAEDVFGFVQRVAGDQADLSRMEDEVDERVKGDYGRILARGAVAGQRQALEASYGADPDARSHGETFLGVLKRRLVPGGLYFLDEPEAPLSPVRILALMSLLKAGVEEGGQFVIATHSPILMGLPDAEILHLDEDGVRPTAFDDVEHVRLTRAFLNNPDAYLRRL